MEQDTPLYWKWFDDGHIEEAILGVDKYFIPSVTYRSYHDSGLIISQLLLWAQRKGAPQIAWRAIERAICRAADQDDPENAFLLLWTCFVVTDDMKVPMAIDEKNILSPLKALINRRASDIARNEEVRGLIEDVAERMPALLER